MTKTGIMHEMAPLYSITTDYQWRRRFIELKKILSPEDFADYLKRDKIIVQRLKRARRPWENIYFGILTRCNNPKQQAYKYYGGKGIKCLMTMEEVKTLWFRDNASAQKFPSIDRIDSAGHYIFSNCRFIEKSENSSRAHKGRKKPRLSSLFY